MFYHCRRSLHLFLLLVTSFNYVQSKSPDDAKFSVSFICDYEKVSVSLTSRDAVTTLPNITIESAALGNCQLKSGVNSAISVEYRCDYNERFSLANLTVYDDERRPIWSSIFNCDDFYKMGPFKASDLVVSHIKRGVVEVSYGNYNGNLYNFRVHCVSTNRYNQVAECKQGDSVSNSSNANSMELSGLRAARTYNCSITQRFTLSSLPSDPTYFSFTTNASVSELNPRVALPAYANQKCAEQHNCRHVTLRWQNVLECVANGPVVATQVELFLITSDDHVRQSVLRRNLSAEQRSFVFRNLATHLDYQAELRTVTSAGVNQSLSPTLVTMFAWQADFDCSQNLVYVTNDWHLRFRSKCNFATLPNSTLIRSARICALVDAQCNHTFLDQFTLAGNADSWDNLDLSLPVPQVFRNTLLESVRDDNLLIETGVFLKSNSDDQLLRSTGFLSIPCVYREVNNSVLQNTPQHNVDIHSVDVNFAVRSCMTHKTRLANKFKLLVTKPDCLATCDSDCAVSKIVESDYNSLQHSVTIESLDSFTDYQVFLCSFSNWNGTVVSFLEWSAAIRSQPQLKLLWLLTGRYAALSFSPGTSTYNEID